MVRLSPRKTLINLAWLLPRSTLETGGDPGGLKLLQPTVERFQMKKLGPVGGESMYPGWKIGETKALATHHVKRSRAINVNSSKIHDSCVRWRSITYKCPTIHLAFDNNHDGVFLTFTLSWWNISTYVCSLNSFLYRLPNADDHEVHVCRTRSQVHLKSPQWQYIFPASSLTCCTAS